MEKVLLTGGNGFLIRNMMAHLSMYRCYTLARSGNHPYKVDLSNAVPVFEICFDVVFHAAGKAHTIPRNKQEEDDFFAVNLTGTMNLCKGLEQKGVPKQFIYVSSVAVYGKTEGIDIDESTPLAGDTPYALSKIQAERFLIAWCREHAVKLVILRPALIAGINPPGNLGAMIKGLKTYRYASIAGGNAHKSIIMAEDFARLIPLLSTIELGVYNVCADYAPSFRELELSILKQLGRKRVLSISLPIMRQLARIGDCFGESFPINSRKLHKITSDLTFSNKAIKECTGWKPLDVLSNFKIEA